MFGWSAFSSGCKRSMNHFKEGLEHEAKHRCRYSAQYDNRIYTCKVSKSPNSNTTVTRTACWASESLLYLQVCYEKGKEVIVVPKTTASSDSPWFGLAIYAWSG